MAAIDAMREMLERDAVRFAEIRAQLGRIDVRDGARKAILAEYIRHCEVETRANLARYEEVK